MILGLRQHLRTLPLDGPLWLVAEFFNSSLLLLNLFESSHQIGETLLLWHLLINKILSETYLWLLLVQIVLGLRSTSFLDADTFNLSHNKFGRRIHLLLLLIHDLRWMLNCGIVRRDQLLLWDGEGWSVAHLSLLQHLVFKGFSPFSVFVLDEGKDLGVLFEVEQLLFSHSQLAIGLFVVLHDRQIYRTMQTRVAQFPLFGLIWKVLNLLEIPSIRHELAVIIHDTDAAFGMDVADLFSTM